MSTLRNITVLGSGVLGEQIAWQSAFRGKTVVDDVNRTAHSLRSLGIPPGAMQQ